MTPHDLIVAFDTLAEAPDGVKRLRELVLQLAVRGKLVPQHPEDEPASVLLARVGAQQARLIKSKTIRQKEMAPVGENESPFDVPPGWSWTRIWNAAHDLGQEVPSSLFSYIDVSTIDKERGVIGGEVSVLRAEDAPSRARKKVARGCVIYSTVRPYLRNIAVVDRDFQPAPIVSTAFSVLMPYAGISSHFLYYYLRSAVFVDYVEQHQKGVAYPAINDGDFQVAPVPIPPLAEQHRIVARVDELMGLLDRLEAARTARDTTRAAARDAALAALREADTPEEVEVAWNRFAERMDDLLCDPADIDPLRQAVLQLAVRGTLVPQDARDEPASVLLERIAAEKSARGKSKHDRPMRCATAPFDAPGGWEWALMGGLSHIERGGSPRPIQDYITDDPDGLNWIKIGDTEIGGKYITSTNQRIRKEGLRKTRMVFPGDFLLTNSMSFGRPYITKIEGCIHDGWLRIHPPASLNKDYLYLVLSSPFIVAQFNAAAAGAVVMNLNADKVRDVPVPLPPLAEQYRIVARVDELMGLLDRLEARLIVAQTTHDSFASAAVHHLDA